MTVLHDYWRSSASYRVRIALNLLGLAHERRSVDLLRGEQRGADHLRRNPQGLVPALEIDGLVLTQSLAIIEYLDETRGPCFLPADPAGRARVRALAHAVAMEIAPVCNLSVRNHAAAISGGTVSADDWQRHFIPRGFTALEAMLANPATASYCHGDQVSLADLCLVPQAYNAERAGLDLATWPRLAAIVARLRALPEVAAAHPDAVRPR